MFDNHQTFFVCRLNFIEVLRYYLNSGRIKPDYHDNHKRTLICLAVVHSQPAMLEFLLADVSFYIKMYLSH